MRPWQPLRRRALPGDQLNGVPMQPAPCLRHPRTLHADVLGRARPRGRHRRLGRGRRRRPVLLVRRGRRSTTAGTAASRPSSRPSTAAIAYAGDLQIELVCQDERRAGRLPRRVRPRRATGCTTWPSSATTTRPTATPTSPPAPSSPSRRPIGNEPHLLGRHHADARVHGRAARAEPTRGTGGSPHMRRPPRAGTDRGTAPTRSPASRPAGARRCTSLRRRRRSRSCSPTVVAARADHPALIVADETLTYARARSALRPAWPGRCWRPAPARAPASRLLAPDGALLADHVLRRAAHRRAGHPDQHAGDAARAGPHPAHERRADPRSVRVASCAATSPRTSTAALPGLADADAAALRLPRAPHLRSVWLDDADGLAWARPIDELLALRRRARARPTTTLLAAVEREVSPATTRSSSTPRAAPRRRRPSCTASGRSPRQPRVAGAIYFMITAEDRTHAAAAGVLDGWHRRRAPGAEHRQARSSTRRRPTSTTCSTRSSTTTSPTSSSGTAGQAARRGQGPGHRRRPHPRPRVADPRRARRAHPRARCGPTCSACRRASRAHSAEPVDRRTARGQGRRLRPRGQRHRTPGRRPRDRRGGAAGRGRRAAAPRRRR